jgi:O-antigen ligase
MPVQYLSRLSTLSDIIPGWGDPRTEISLRGRLSENTVAWMMFSDHPILGVGLDNYPALYQQYSRQLGLDPRLEPRDPHNLYLEIASQLGLVGLAVFGVLVWFMFRGLLQAHRDFRAGAMKDYAEMTAAFAIAMFGYLSAALFLHSAYDRYFWLLFGIGLALPQVARHELASRDLVEETHLEDPPIPELPGPEGT